MLTENDRNIYEVELIDEKTGTVNPNASNTFKSIVNSLCHAKVDYLPIKLFGRERTSEEIVGRLSGGDLTEGSCSSLALAYIGNRAGYDVLDFRDGASRAYFSNRDSIKNIATLPDVKSSIVYGKNDVENANSLLNEMAEGKEYYLATGQHASIVRKNGNHFEYLELQHPGSRNGWQYLDDYVLINRFGCDVSRTFKNSSFLIEAESLAHSQEFLNTLGYINTVEFGQKKGVTGNVR